MTISRTHVRTVPAVARWPAALALLAVLALAGCGPDAGTTTTSPAVPGGSDSSSTSPGPSTEPTSEPASPAVGCQSVSTPEPAGATTREVPDADGDGTPDTGWIALADGTVEFGVSTAAGGSFGTTFSLPGGAAERSVLITPVDTDGTVVALATDGRTVLLFRVLDCAFVPVMNAQGEQYSFSLGFTDYGTGVGCVVDGATPTALVGLLATRSGDSTVVASTRIDISGTTATNGPTTEHTYPSADAAVAAAHDVTCGDRTLADDGLTVSG